VVLEVPQTGLLSFPPHWTMLSQRAPGTLLSERSLPVLLSLFPADESAAPSLSFRGAAGLFLPSPPTR